MLMPYALLLSLASIIPVETISLLPQPFSKGSPAPVHVAQLYNDLPGVKSQEEAEDEKRVFCEQSVVAIEGHPTYGPRYQTVNNCRKGNGPVFNSPRTPLSLERQKRGLNY